MTEEFTLEPLAEQLGGAVQESGETGYAIIASPLSSDHWIYGDPAAVIEKGDGWSIESPPMPMRAGTDDPRRTELAEMLTLAGRYAVRAATLGGKDMNFDPDALLQNLIIGMLGYCTADGLSGPSSSTSNPS